MRQRQRSHVPAGPVDDGTSAPQRYTSAAKKDAAEKAADSISKSEMKRRMLALQEVGEALVELSAERLTRLDMPEELRKAVLEARRITAHGGRKRQLQYIGRIMRDIDAQPIVTQLEQMRAPDKQEVARQHLAQRWRDALIEAPSVAEELTRIAQEVDVDGPSLTTLVAQAAHQKAHGQPPRAYRTIYQILKQAIDAKARAIATAQGTGDGGPG
jgi:ribosome-associated protein